MSSTFQNVQLAPPDSIFGVSAKYNASPLNEKYILSVGVYRSEEGKPYVYPAISKAEDKIIHNHPKDYLPMKGYAPFLKGARELLWTPELLEQYGDRIATVQTCAGTGALYMVAKLTSYFLDAPKILLSDPTWPNYYGIFGGQRNKIGTYKYLKNGVLDLEGLNESLMEQPDDCVVVLQVCGHNPTGVDPTLDQWKSILQTIQTKKDIICFDFAYMGLASGDPEHDCGIIRQALKSGLEFFVCFSFSKCMGLYGERIGCLHAVCANKEEAKAVESQIEIIGRQCYSVCPQNGALIAAEVLNDPTLKNQWIGELKACAKRIIDIREKFCDLLEEKTGRNWEFVRKQKGLFSYLLLTANEVEMLGAEGVFIPSNGRITVSAMNNSNVGFIAQAIANVLTKEKNNNC